MFEVIVERFFPPPPGGRGYSSERVAGKCETEAEAKIKVASLKNEHTGDFYVSYRKATEKLLEVKEVKTMITAKEARDLVEQSEASMTRRLDQLSEKIKEAAMLGKRELWVTSALPYHKEFEVEKKPFYPAEFTPLQRLIEKELKRQGFTMKIEDREVTIGGGFKSMDVESKIEMRPYIRITW